jgi:ribosomal protein S18 acetylase RimI-like enzyme
MEIQYKISAAHEFEILELLRRTSDRFSPALETYVDLKQYAQKIYNNATTFEAWDGKIFIGFVAAYLNDDESKQGFITLVVLDEKYASQGIAHQLFNLLIEQTKKIQYKSLLLEVSPTNEHALNFYTRFGFLKDGHKDGRVQMKFSVI